ncbi:response regulator transcription factor [Ktedonobacter robiniae]|uniref:DNA-binding response regulator n=1 Tax=Ktedonobacter robiniae TaxID=2778365 RepID=A0ABQ3ULH9_9CHLR|nr:response regulator transcription factor [Ktedonobacter robiniae]GHO53521.1 DNA-binding response regulator [Ktedonobacter robiniae]
MNDASKPLRLLIASAHPVVCEGLRTMLAGSPDIQLLAIATSLPETMRLVGELQPQVLLIDTHIHQGATLKSLSMMHGEWPALAIVGLAMHADDPEFLLACLQTGMATCLPLHASRMTILQALAASVHKETLLQHALVRSLLKRIEGATPVDERSSAQAQWVDLTERELEVLTCVAHGQRNKEIATYLSISEPTVKTHLANIYFKLQVDSRASAVAVAMKRGLITHEKASHTGKDQL